MLFEKAPTLEAVEEALSGFKHRRAHANVPPGWMSSGTGLVADLFPSINGRAAIDVFASEWPDGMGDPKSDAMLFGAWTMGFFGPFTFPGNLERAVQHSYEFEAAGRLARAHRAFVRVNASYVFGAGPDAKVSPEGYDALTELEAMTRLGRELLSVPGALVYFNPSGEVLADAERIDGTLGFARGADVSPMPLWSNVRMAHLSDVPGWIVMDTIGMGQLDRDDLEAVFPASGFDPGNVAGFLRNAAEYLRARGPVVKDGNTMDGPGRHWVASMREEGVMPGLGRPVLRWSPQGVEVPEGLR